MGEWRFLGSVLCLAALLWVGNAQVTVGFDMTSYTVSEDNSTAILSVTVLSGSVDNGVLVVTASTEPETAVADEDYTAISANLTFDSATTSLQVSIPILDNGPSEDTETFTVTLMVDDMASTFNETDSVSVNPDSTTVFVEDNDAVTFMFDAASYSGGEGETVDVCVSISMGTLERSVTVNITEASGSASANDYNGVMSLTFVPGGNTSMCISISLMDDDGLEGDEMLSLHLVSNQDRVMFGSLVYASVNILDNDMITVGFSAPMYSVMEGGTVQVCVSVTAGSLQRDATVQITVDATSTASAGDYSGVMNLTLTAGSTMGCIDISATQDDALEEDETLILQLGSADGSVMLGTGTNTTITITNDDIATVSLVGGSTQSVIESDGVIMVCVSLSPVANIPVTVNVATMNGTAVSGQDFEGVNMVVVIGAGSIMECVPIMILEDTLVEDDEMFTVVLTSSQDAVMVMDDTLTITITADPQDTAEVTVPAMVTGSEGMVSVCVELMGELGRQVQLMVTSQSGTAISGTDFTAVNDVLTFAAAGRMCVNVSIDEDNVLENEESFQLIFSSTDPLLLFNGGNTTTTIVITDTTVVEIGFEMAAYSVMEGMTLSVCVAVGNGMLDRNTTIVFTTQGVTAMDLINFMSVMMEMLVLGVHSSRECVEISTMDDQVFEENTLFRVELSSSETDRVTLMYQSANVTILENDELVIGLFPLSATVESSVTVVEGNQAPFVLRLLNGTLGTELLLTVSTRDFSTTAGVDYDALMENVVFNSTLSERNLYVMTRLDNDTREDAEAFDVTVTTGNQSGLIFLMPSTIRFTIADAPAILQPPEPQFVMLDEPALFMVVASGFNLSFQWLLNDANLEDGSTVSGSRTPNLTISNVSNADFGNYSVRVSNLVTNITSDPAPLALLIVPEIMEFSDDVGVALGSGATLRCNALLQDGILMIEWSSDSTIDLPEPVTMEVGNMLTSTLTLDDISLNSTGQYTCTATNRVDSVNRTINLFAITVVGVEDVVATRGTTATLMCTAIGHPDLAYRWARVEAEGMNLLYGFPGQVGRVAGQNSSTLTIREVSRNDDAPYACNVWLFDQLVAVTSGNLTTRGPMILESPMSVTVNEGDTLRLNCTARNNSDAVNPLTFLWVDNRRENLRNALTEEFDLGNGTVQSQLIIRSVTRGNAGEAGFACTVHSSQELDREESDSAIITVNFAPMVTWSVDGLSVDSFELRNGESADLICGVMARPTADMIEVVSRFGEEEENVMVDSNDNRTDITATVSPALNLSGIVYMCSATNNLGTGSDSVTFIVQDVPGAVDHSSVTATLNDLLSVTLEWDVPEDNNSPLTTYTINSWRISSGNTFPQESVEVPASTSPRQRSMSLNFDVNSRIRVLIVANNSVGRGQESQQTFEFNTATPENASPVSVMEVFVTETQVVYEWMLPPLATSGDVVLAQFDVTVTPQAGVAISSTVMPQDMGGVFGTGQSGLFPGVPHEVSIMAVFSNPNFRSAATLFNFMTVSRDDANPVTLLPTEDDFTPGPTSTTISWQPIQNSNFLDSIVVTTTSTRLPTTTNANARAKRQGPDNMDVQTLDPTDRRVNVQTLPFSRVAVDVVANYMPPGIAAALTVPVIPTVTFNSDEADPGPPTDLNGVQNGLNALDLTWTPPSEPNGNITEHTVRFNEVGNPSLSNRPTMSPSNSYTLTGLDADTNYDISIAAINGAGPGQHTPIRQFKTAFGVYPPSVAVLTTSVRGQFTLAIGFRDVLGPIRFFQVVVVVTRTEFGTTRTINTSIPSQEQRYYVAYQSDLGGSNQVNFDLGTGNSAAHSGIVFNNTLLNGGTDYYVFIRAFSDRNPSVYNDSALSTAFSFASPLNTVAIIVPIAAIAVILLIILVVLLLFAYLTMHGTFRRGGYAPKGTGLLEDGKRRNKSGAAMELRRTRLFSPVVNVGSPDVFTSAGQPTTLICEASGTPAPEVTWTHNDQPLDKERFIQLADGSLFINDTDLQDEGTYVVRANNLAGEAEVAVRVTVLRPIPPESDADHSPIKVGEFSEKIALVRAEDDEGLEDEYADVELDWTFTSYAAKLNINKNKNRYINIIPYDHSRVVLSLQDNTPGSDYINASFIDAYQRPNGYIASQGPIPSTFPDFWRMIWELDSPTIVMVTNLKEEDKVKCHQYWPSYGTTTYGNIQVTLKEVENLAEYSIRTFNISPLAGQSRVPMPVREVRQFHFLVWPDHGVPVYATNLLSFRKRILKYHPEKRGPMAVHCSAGVGRTGTFITIDYMLKQMEAEGSIDIFNFVRHMRYRRNYMVQTSPQYVFIHDALLESIMCGDNSIKAPELKAKVKELQGVVPESGKSMFETQFATLTTASPPDDDFDCSIAQLPDNKLKNRSQLHLPANDYRVTLSTDGDQSDYICASYVDNYRERNAFIVTQAPLSNTVADFWRMMWETKSAAIVMLTELTEGDEEMCVKYWPSGVGDPSVYGGFQVELSEEEKDRGSYITRRFKLSAVDKAQESRMVSQFHFTKWTKTTPPTDCRPMIDLIDELQRVQRKSGNMPITVHCDDGVSRTGAFCALYSVLERVKTEQIVDVFQAVKTLRIQRAGLLGTIEEYEFVHRAVIEFLETFSDYQNFK